MRVGEELAGLRARCPDCGRSVRIPSPGGSTAAAAGKRSWLATIIAAGLLLLLAAGLGFGIVYVAVNGLTKKDDSTSSVQGREPAPPPRPSPARGEGDSQPLSARGEGDSPRSTASKEEDPPLEAPRQSPKPEPPPVPLPKVEIKSVEPVEPQAGKPLSIHLQGNRDGLQFEYRTDPDEAWQPAPEGRATLATIKPGPLTVEARAVDEQKRVSDVVSRTWLVKSDLPDTLLGVSGDPKSPRAEMPDKGRVQGAEPPKDPMKPLVQGGAVKEPNLPRVQGGDPRRDPQLLLWKLKPADKLFQEVQVAQKSAYRIQGLEPTTAIQYSVLSSFVVDKKNEDGSLHLTQKIEAVKLVQADSITEGLLGSALQKMPGTVYKLKLNAQMEVTDFEGHQNPLRVFGGDPFGGGGAFAMASLIDKDGWKEIDQLTFFQPGRPLRQGDRWQKPMTHSWGALGNWNGQVTYGYGGKQGQFHRVAYALNLTHAPAKMGTGGLGLPFQVAASNFKHQEAGGMVYFDLEKGRVVGAEERFHVKGLLNIAAAGQNAPVEVDEEQAFRVIVYDRNPWGR
jgi:hypothetical protein